MSKHVTRSQGKSKIKKTKDEIKMIRTNNGNNHQFPETESRYTAVAPSNRKFDYQILRPVDKEKKEKEKRKKT